MKKLNYLIFIVLFFNNLSFAEARSIANSSSPYVAMHAKDKIHWQEWGSAALAQSQKENKPLFLSIGYFSCYWCHVLQRESFSNDALAELVNANFIPVIVDRELNSSLDTYLTRFSEETTGRGGWPLNVIITPEGYPLVSTIYLPVNNFNEWLKKVSDLWVKDEDSLKRMAEDAAEEMSTIVAAKPEVVTLALRKKIDDKFVTEVLSVADEFQGGFGDQAKFPLVAILQTLLKQYEKNKNTQLADFLKLTLNTLRSKGLFDHLDGGFFRYTTDPDWQLPHFEKMLYDNAQMASLYLLAGSVFQSDFYTQIGIRQLDYLIENFQSESGGFYASYSAIDESGVEGGYYLWSKEQISKILSLEEQKAVDSLWAWGQPPLLDDGFFPVPQMSIADAAKQLKMSPKKIRQLLLSSKEKLRTNRQSRDLPRDDKILASWNALALIALTDGYIHTRLPRFKNAANTLGVFISKQLIKGEELHRSLHKEQYSGRAGLEDYAYVATALYRWSLLDESLLDEIETSLNKKSDREIGGRELFVARSQSIAIAKTAWKRFWNKGGWKISDDMLIPNLSQEAMIADGPLPSASAMLIDLGYLTRDESLLALSEKAMGYGHDSLKNAPFWYASHVDVITNRTNYVNPLRKK